MASKRTPAIDSTLSERDRSLITVACLVALNRSTELPFHLGEALANGVSREQVIELVAQLARLNPQALPSF